MIDPSADRALYRQVADELRARIDRGEYAPGTRLPSELHIRQEYGVGKTTVAEAIALLRHEGRIETIRGYGSVVREHSRPTWVDVAGEATVHIRRATDDERRRLDLYEGAPVMVISRPGREDEVRSAENVIIEFRPPR